MTNGKGLGSLLRLLIAELDGGLQRTYDAMEAKFRPRYFPIVQQLRGEDPIGVSALAASIGMTQPAVSQTLREMERDGLIGWSQGPDKRQRLVALSSDGETLCHRLEPVWAAAAASIDELERDAGVDLAGTLVRTLAALADRSFEQRVAEQFR